MFRLVGIFLVFSLLGLATPANAATYTFEIDGAELKGSSTLPYGLASIPSQISGSVTFDVPYTGLEFVDGPQVVAKFTDVDFQVGSQTWTEANLSYAAVWFFDGRVSGFAIAFPGNTDIEVLNETLYGFVHISDGSSQLFCRGCLTSNIPPIPEPSTWAMVLLGLGGVCWIAVRRSNQPALS